MTQESLVKNEFPFSDQDFDRIRSLLLEHTGISLPDSKRNMMYSRLVRRLRSLQLESFANYISHVEQEVSAGTSAEMLQMINALTTNVTNFFREHHHFDTLIMELEKRIEQQQEIRIWSAGCSTGQEPYTIAMVVDAFCKQHPNVKVSILATDLDTAVIEQAKQGVYTLDKIEVEKHPYLSQYMEYIEPSGSTITPNDAVFKVTESLRSYISFDQINLVKHWNHIKKFDFIFCRNVMIYFNTETKNDLCRRYADTLNSQGLLFIGHSEAIKTTIPSLEPLGGTTYRKL